MAGWKQRLLAELHAGFGEPVDQLRRIWQESLRKARIAPQDQRPRIVATGAPAAIGLFVVSADSTPLTELRTIVGEPVPNEIRAVLKLRAGDSSAARKVLAETVSELSRQRYPYPYRYLAAQVHQLLGEDAMTIKLLAGYEESLSTGRFDSGWTILGRIRLLRAASYERLGRFREAREEYARVLEQWRSADESLEPYIRQARQGFARVTEP
jgi:hypothetical protein